MKSKHLIPLAFVTLAGFLPPSKASIFLGLADRFAVLGGSGVTSTGNTVLNGDLGVSPGTAITGFAPGIVNGAIHNNDAVAIQAQTDALAAYNSLAGETPNQNLTGQDLGGQTLNPGVYYFSSSAQLTGTLTLSGTGDFVFQIGSTLTTASSSSVLLINGAQADNVFWQIGSSATVGDGTSFDGSIIADSSITMDTGASLSGRALALNGAVSLDDNRITIVPEAGAFWPLVFCTSVFGAREWLVMRRRKSGRS